jgi:hypothetical protein
MDLLVPKRHGPPLRAAGRGGPRTGMCCYCHSVAQLARAASVDDHAGVKRVKMSWKGDSEATAPIGRKASTSVMPVLELIQTQEILALNGVPPELFFGVCWQVSLVLKTCTKVVFLFSLNSIAARGGRQKKVGLTSKKGFLLVQCVKRI